MDPNNNQSNNQQTPQQTPPTPVSVQPPGSTQPSPVPPVEQPVNPPIVPEPIEQPAPEPSEGTIPPRKKSNAGLVIILILIIIITLGVLSYILLNYLGYIGGGQQQVQQEPSQTQEVMIPQPTIASSSADSDIKALGSQSDSDEVNSIEADITGTDLTNLDKEVDSINNQL